MLVRIWRNRYINALLVGIYTSITIIEDNLEITQKSELSVNTSMMHKKMQTVTSMGKAGKVNKSIEYLYDVEDKLLSH